MKKIMLVLLAVSAFTSAPSFACDVTISAGSNVISSAVSSASTGQTICLNAGTYTQTSSIQLKQNQTLEGLGADRTNTVISTSATEGIVLAAGSTVHNLYIKGASLIPASFSTTGIIGNNAPNAIIWGVRVEYFVDGISLYGSDDASLWDVFMYNTGHPSNSKADPGIFLYDSNHVEVLYGYLEGENDGPFGDGGSLACFGSTDLLIDGTQFVFSGNSAVYFVDCDSSTVQNANIYGSNEWGLDIVGGATAGYSGPPLYLNGTSGFQALNNTITNSYFGGSVFDEPANGAGYYNGNTFTGNNTSGTRSCQGINVIGGNTANISGSNAGSACAY